MTNHKKKSLMAYANQNTLYIALVLACVFVVINLVPRAIIKNDAINNTSIIANSVQLLIKDTVNDVERTMDNAEIIFKSSLYNNHDLNTLDRYFSNYQLITSFEIIDENGKVVFATPLDTVGMDRSGERFFGDIDQTDGFYWSNVSTYFLTGQPVISVAKKYDNYFFQAYIDLEQFSASTAIIHQELNHEFSISVMDNHGIYVVDSNPDMLYQRVMNDEFEQIKRVVSEKTYHFDDIGKNSQVSVAYIEPLDWYVALYSPNSEVFSSIRVINIIIIAASLIMIVTLWFYYRRTIKITRLIHMFSERIDEYSDKNVTLPLEEAKFLELDILNRNFQTMRSNLVNSITQEKKMELKFLRSQIQPHFINNSLNAIIAIMRYDIDESRALLIEFSRYLRSCYDFQSLEDTIPIENELAYIKSYLALEKARFQDKLTIEYEIDHVRLSVPPLILQPLVENAIIHGVRHMPAGGTVRIYVQDRGALVRLGVYDTGRGINEENLAAILNGNNESKHIGLLNINQRLEKIYNISLHFCNLPDGGFDVYMDIPIQEK